MKNLSDIDGYLNESLRPGKIWVGNNSSVDIINLRGEVHMDFQLSRSASIDSLPPDAKKILTAKLEELVKLVDELTWLD